MTSSYPIFFYKIHPFLSNLNRIIITTQPLKLSIECSCVSDHHQMDSSRFNLGQAAILVATMMWAGASAQSSSCTSALINLPPCLNYITGNDTSPSSSCCSQLSSVVSSEPLCICMVLNGGASQLGITINQTRALALPDACNVKTTPVSKRNSGGGQSSSPSVPSTPTTPSSGFAINP